MVGQDAMGHRGGGGQREEPGLKAGAHCAECGQVILYSSWGHKRGSPVLEQCQVYMYAALLCPDCANPPAVAVADQLRLQ
jgi:hypothetical protein